ncbi:MAG: hypothetical protein IJU50_07295 [Lachnospiraceae bacterium]|nr:hypothetical protein [Lachnospiraceae bacterium]
MTICKVLKMMPIEDNTAVVVDGSEELFRNGIGVLDENGKPFEVLSVGMEKVANSDELVDRTSLLLNGRFSSKKMFV